MDINARQSGPGLIGRMLGVRERIGNGGATREVILGGYRHRVLDSF